MSHRPVVIAALVALALLAGRQAASAAEAMEPQHAFDPALSAPDFAEHVRVLASDAFAGRDPGSPEEQRTLDYLAGQFKRMGLAPGNGDSYFQPVPMQVRLADRDSSQASISAAGKTLRLDLEKQAVLGSDLGQAEVTVADSELVFVGFGIHAPEQGWDDYADADVRGKTVVAIAGEPEGGEGFDGRRLTYYSRLGYKAQEAARRGAAAILVLHDEAGAGYDWTGVLARWHNREYALRPEDRDEPPVAVQGWLSADGARALFSAAGVDLRDARKAATRPGFRAHPLGDARFSATLRGKVLRGQSMNVVAMLRGRTHPGEAVVYMAHWDHLGTVPQRAGDNIYNGALDNATGVAAVLELAEAFARQPQAPERSLVFLLPTLEELGLLGSRYYTLHPALPMADTVATLNFDMVVPIGRTRDYAVIGVEHSELEAVVKPIVSAQGRVLSAGRPDATDEFLRSDHLSFARAGVPVLYLRGGVEARGGGTGRQLGEGDRSWVTTAAVYHTPDDEFDPDWNLAGVLEDLEVAYALGQQLANGRAWPNYVQGQPYRTVRDASRATASGK